ncbi:MAG: glycoside hydrolase family 31 protein [Sedimentisphaerales bacterium]|nr:glycoside hydrolase family 31 protein [Sedimentisphaerales bacterium]
MRNRTLGLIFILNLAWQAGHAYAVGTIEQSGPRPVLILPMQDRQGKSLRIDGLFFRTLSERTVLPSGLQVRTGDTLHATLTLDGGRTVNISIEPQDQDYLIRLTVDPNRDIIGWGLAIEAADGEYFTGLMERVVDGPQQASWAPGIKQAMDLRGQRVEMILKPTTSVYAPFYLSSAGYATFVKGTWPGLYDFCVTDPNRVKIEFEGPTFEMKVYVDKDPADLVCRHGMDAGPPVMPPRWMFTPWRWRDEHRHRTAYYDGTPVKGPFNSEVMEDILMMTAFGIPCGVYWVDRPYGPGRLGYDDFEIDPNRLPHFPEMVKWLNSLGTQMVLWIGPFFQGQMEKEALAKGYNLPGQRPMPNNYPLCDFTNPQARAYWQQGLSKLVRLGVAGFKLDRAEEDIPDGGPFNVFDGRSLREQRNDYPVMYLRAAYELVRQFRGDDFVLMPRAAYTGSSRYGVFWGGDIGGTQEGLRASIIAVQRSALMGYPFWGSDTCGYNQQLLEQEVCARWLGFSCFCPIMEVGPTRNVGFWNLPRQPSYDEELIAIWRLYARLHQRLIDYGYEQAKIAHKTGMPIVRPLFLVDPNAPEAWSNWWTYLYGPDIVVSPIWEKGKRTCQVYLPSGSKWRYAWQPDTVYQGGQTVTVQAELYQTPFFVRVGADLPIGDLNQEYRQSRQIAQQRPNLAELERDVIGWFEKLKAD